MPLEGMSLGQYCLLHPIRSDGMGNVYLALDTQLNRQVAIKLIRTESTSYHGSGVATKASHLFQSEAKIISLLNHANILPLLDYSMQVVEGIPLFFLVMPFCQEGSLADWLLRQSVMLSPYGIAHLVGQTAAALQYAHDQQVIHRDVKPSNILIHGNKEQPRRPNLLLADFSLATFNTTSPSMGQPIHGTPTYMSPEQWDGHSVPATDQYALAITAYELLTGRPPFEGDTMYIEHQHIKVQPKPPSSLNPRLPIDIDEVILHALAKDPAKRFMSVSAFARAFYQAIEGRNLAQTDNMNIPGKSKGRDIAITLAISRAEALNGTRRLLPWEGRQENVIVPPGAYAGQIIRLEGRGEPSTIEGPVGDLLITIAVTDTEVPPTPSKAPEIIFRPQIASVSASRSHETSNDDTRRLTPIQASIVWCCILTILGMSLVGIVLDAFGRLQTPIIVLAVGLGSLLGLIATVWAATREHLRVLWTIAKPRLVLSMSVGILVLLTTLTVLVSWNSSLVTATDPYIYKGKLVINDSLKDHSTSLDWDTGATTINGTLLHNCNFTAATYQVTVYASNWVSSCTLENFPFTDFVYEVQMKIVQGNAGGITFGYDISSQTGYYFGITTNGACGFGSFDKKNTPLVGKTLHCSSVNVGQGASNILAVVADGTSLVLYVNHLRVFTETRNNYSQGLIGVGIATDNYPPSTAEFTNAKVWTLD